MTVIIYKFCAILVHRWVTYTARMNLGLGAVLIGLLNQAKDKNI